MDWGGMRCAGRYVRIPRVLAGVATQQVRHRRCHLALPMFQTPFPFLSF